MRKARQCGPRRRDWQKDISQLRHNRSHTVLLVLSTALILEVRQTCYFAMKLTWRQQWTNKSDTTIQRTDSVDTTSECDQQGNYIYRKNSSCMTTHTEKRTDTRHNESWHGADQHYLISNDQRWEPNHLQMPRRIITWTEDSQLHTDYKDSRHHSVW